MLWTRLSATAGGQHPQTGAGDEELADARRRGQEMLDVVENQQETLAPQPRAERIGQGPIPALLHVEAMRNRGQDKGRILDRSKRRERRRATARAGRIRRRRLDEPGLAHAARTGQRDQPGIAAGQEGVNRRALVLPADDGMHGSRRPGVPELALIVVGPRGAGGILGILTGEKVRHGGAKLRAAIRWCWRPSYQMCRGRLVPTRRNS